MNRDLNWGKCTTCWDKGYYYSFFTANEEDLPLADNAKRHYCECPIGKIRKDDEENPIEL